MREHKIADDTIIDRITSKTLSDHISKIRNDEPKSFNDTPAKIDKDQIDSKIDKDRLDPIKGFDPTPNWNRLDWNVLEQPGLNRGISQRPFVLGTPHHAPTLTTTGSDPEELRRNQQLAQYESMISELDNIRKQGERYLDLIESEYERLSEEYEELLESDEEE